MPSTPLPLATSAALSPTKETPRAGTGQEAERPSAVEELQEVVVQPGLGEAALSLEATPDGCDQDSNQEDDEREGEEGGPTYDGNAH